MRWWLMINSLALLVVYLMGWVSPDPRLFTFQEERQSDLAYFDVYAQIHEAPGLEIYVVKSDQVLKGNGTPYTHLLIIADTEKTQTITLSCGPYKALDIDHEMAQASQKAYLIQGVTLEDYCYWESDLTIYVDEALVVITNPLNDDGESNFAPVSIGFARSMRELMIDYRPLMFRLVSLSFVMLACLSMYRFVHEKNMNRFITSSKVRKLPELSTVYAVIIVLGLLVATVFVTTFEPKPSDYTHPLYVYHEAEAHVDYLLEADFLRDYPLLIETDTYAFFYREMLEYETYVIYFALKHNERLYHFDATGIDSTRSDIERCYTDTVLEGDLETGLFIGFVVACYRLVEGDEVRSTELRFDAETHYNNSQPSVSKLNYQYVFYENNNGVYRVRNHD